MSIMNIISIYIVNACNPPTVSTKNDKAPHTCRNMRNTPVATSTSKTNFSTFLTKKISSYLTDCEIFFITLRRICKNITNTYKY